MNFVFKTWDKFCYKLHNAGKISVRAKDVLENKVKNDYIVLKHDVETAVKKAYKIAKIESKYGHKGSYYVQAYLLNSKKNLSLLHKMQQLGHEITYHHDVMDFSGGDIAKAKQEYESNVLKFQEEGFEIITVCQHGNPVIERNGYYSNRDFFRNKAIAENFSAHADIMVNFPEKAQTEYLYFSDAGKKFKLIYDPINNDVVNSSEKDKPYKSLNVLFEEIDGNNAIISMHPHRWGGSILVGFFKTIFFKIVKRIVKLLIKVPIMKKFFSKYYYLAKKI